MSQENQIPEVDSQLALKIGTILEEDRSVLSADDYLIDRIVDHKKNLYSAYQKELSESKETSWRKISLSIQEEKKSTPSRKSKANVHSLFSSKSLFLKVAAVLVVSIFITLFFFQTEVNQPTLLAQSNAEQVTYTLNDGSSIHLRPSSTLFAISKTDAEIRYKLEGEAFFQVTPNQDRRFIVEAGTGIVEVTGTSFNVREWGSETIIYLQEGAVQFSNSNGSKKVILSPGEMAVAHNNQSITDPVKADPEQFLSWQQNEIIFENRTAESIIKELEYHYSIEINAPEHVKNEVLGGSLSLENQSISLQNLGIVLGGNFSSIGDNKYQFVE